IALVFHNYSRFPKLTSLSGVLASQQLLAAGNSRCLNSYAGQSFAYPLPKFPPPAYFTKVCSALAAALAVDKDCKVSMKVLYAEINASGFSLATLSTFVWNKRSTVAIFCASSSAGSETSTGEGTSKGTGTSTGAGTSTEADLVWFKPP